MNYQPVLHLQNARASPKRSGSPPPAARAKAPASVSSPKTQQVGEQNKHEKADGAAAAGALDSSSAHQQRPQLRDAQGRFVKANEAESAEAEPAVAVEAKGTNKVAAESGTARARHADQLRDGTLVLKDRLRVGLLKKNIYQHGCLRQRAILFAKRKSEKKVLEKLKAVSVASEIQVDLKDVSLKQKKALYDRFRLVRRNGQWYGPTWEYVWHTDKSVQVLKTDMLSDELAQRRKTQLQIEGGKRSWEDELEVILKKWGSDVKYWEGEILPSIVAQLSDPHFYSTWRRVKKERELGEKVGGNAVDAVAVEEGKLDVVEKDGLDFGETRGDPAAGAVVEIVGEGDDSFEMNKPVVLPGLTDASIFDGKDPKAKEKKEPEKNPLLPPPPAPPAKPNVTREWLNAEKRNKQQEQQNTSGSTDRSASSASSDSSSSTSSSDSLSEEAFLPLKMIQHRAPRESAKKPPSENKKTAAASGTTATATAFPAAAGSGSSKSSVAAPAGEGVVVTSEWLKIKQLESKEERKKARKALTLRGVDSTKSPLFHTSDDDLFNTSESESEDSGEFPVLTAHSRMTAAGDSGGAHEGTKEKNAKSVVPAAAIPARGASCGAMRDGKGKGRDDGQKSVSLSSGSSHQLPVGTTITARTSVILNGKGAKPMSPNIAGEIAPAPRLVKGALMAQHAAPPPSPAAVDPAPANDRLDACKKQCSPSASTKRQAAPLLAASTAIQKLLDVDDDAVERVMAALSYRYALGDNSTENAVQECTEIVSRFKASWQKNRPNSSNSELADHIVRFCEEKSAGALNKKKQEVAGGRGGGIVVNKSVAAVHGGSKEQQPDGAEAVTSGSSGKAEVLAEKSSASGERKQEVLPVPARGAYAADVDQGQKGGKKTAEKSGEIERPRDKKSDGKIKNNADDGHNSKWNPHPASANSSWAEGSCWAESSSWREQKSWQQRHYNDNSNHWPYSETDYKNYDQHSYREYGRNTDRAPAWCQWRDGGWKKGAGDWKSENDRNEYPLWDAGRESSEWLPRRTQKGRGRRETSRHPPQRKGSGKGKRGWNVYIAPKDESTPEQRVEEAGYYDPRSAGQQLVEKMNDTSTKPKGRSRFEGLYKSPTGTPVLERKRMPVVAVPVLQLQKFSPAERVSPKERKTPSTGAGTSSHAETTPTPATRTTTKTENGIVGAAKGEPKAASSPTRSDRGTPMTIPSGAASVAGGETPILIPDSLKSNNAAARSQDSGISPLVTDAGGGGPPVVEQKKVTSVSENVSASGVTLPLDATKKKKKEADEEPSASAAKKAAAPQSIMPTVSTELKPFGMSLVVLDDDEVVVDKKPSENSDKKPSCSQPPPVVKMQLHDAKQPAPALRLVVEPARVPAGRIVRKQMKPPSRSGSPIKRGGAPSLIASLDLVPVLQRSVLVAGTGTGTPSRHTIGGAKASGASRSGVADTATGAGAPSAAPSPAAAAGAKKEGNLTLTGVPAPTPNAGTIGLSLLNPSILSANPSAVSASLKSRASLLRIRTPPSYSTKKYVKTGEAGAAIAKPKKPVDYNLFNPPARPVDPASPAKASVQAAKRDEVPTATASAAVKKGNTPKPRTSSSPSTSSAHRAAPTANKKRGGTKMTLGVEGSNANVAGRTAAKNDEYWVDLYVVGEPKLNGTYMPQKGIDKENLTYWLNAGKNTKICSHFLAPKGPEGASCWMFRDATTDAPLLRSSLHRRNQNEKDKWAERCFYIPSAVQAWFTLDKTQGIKQHTSLMIAEGDEISKATRVFGVGTEAGAANKAGAATLPVAPQKMNTKKFAKTGTKKPATKPEAAKAAVTSKTKAAASTNITIKKDINSSVNDGSLFSKPLLEAQQSGATTTAGAGEKKPSKPSGQQFPFLTKSNRPAKIAATPPHIALRDNGEADGASKVSSLQKSSKVHGLLKAKTVGKQKAAKASATQPSTAVKKSGTKAESREKAVARKVENRRAQALIEPPPESSDSEA
mmetsp:Transcript_12965/g.31595  ORF Transcript_12965/g.31595 Transcript_12965/m.31595 type:complete len:1972 (+) Transcript_12965:1794-7709(+)